MIENIIFILSILLGSYNLINLINVLVEQYYSLTRLYKYIISTIKELKRYYFGITILLVGILLLNYYQKTLIASFLFLLLNTLLFIESELKKYHITRRNTLLLLFSVIINIILSVFVYKYFSILLVSFLIILNNISLLSAYILLLPIEIIIRNKYIHKAKNKVKNNNYIVIGVTGSFGKTTTKNFIYQFLSCKYLISRQDHNYNTLMGVCKYINNEVKNEDDILLLELGVDAPNQMKKFKKILSLDYAIITSIGEMHLATFKNIKNIIKEKLQINNLLKPNGKLLIEKDIVNRYGSYLNFKYEVYSNEDILYKENFFYQIIYKNQLIDTKLLSIYQIKSLAVTLKLCKLFFIQDRYIILTLKKLELPSRRANIYDYKNLTIVDNSYNGNINGIIELVKKFKTISDNKIVITGGLIELGNKYEKINSELGNELSFFNQIIIISKDKNHPLIKKIDNLDKVIFVETLEKAYSLLNDINIKTYVLLLSKGSNNYLK